MGLKSKATALTQSYSDSTCHMWDHAGWQCTARLWVPLPALLLSAPTTGKSPLPVYSFVAKKKCYTEDKKELSFWSNFEPQHMPSLSGATMRQTSNMPQEGMQPSPL